MNEDGIVCSKNVNFGDNIVQLAMLKLNKLNDAVCIFSYEYLSKTAKSNWAAKRYIRESARLIPPYVS